MCAGRVSFEFSSIFFEVRMVRILTLSGRESDDKKIWAKILISKTRFDAWPVFASDFSVVVKSEVVFFSILVCERDLTDRSLSSLSRPLRVKLFYGFVTRDYIKYQTRLYIYPLGV